MGATGGGVWRTDDAGVSWRNVSDGYFKNGSVGAIGVSLSDPNVIYVGMGEHCVRDVTVSHGDGVYKSTDGGATWANVGLAATRHISKVLVHPGNPDIVLPRYRTIVFVQGCFWHGHDCRKGRRRPQTRPEFWNAKLDGNIARDRTNQAALFSMGWKVFTIWTCQTEIDTKRVRFANPFSKSTGENRTIRSPKNLTRAQAA